MKSRKVDISTNKIDTKKAVELLRTSDVILVKKGNDVYYFELGDTSKGYISVWAYNKTSKRWEYLWRE